MSFNSLFSTDKLKEIDEKIKTLKANLAKKSDKIFLLEKEEDTIIANDVVPDLQTEYKCTLINCLANASSLKEESRKKIAEGKEVLEIVDGETTERSFVMIPIISNGDSLGAVILVGTEEDELVNELDINSAKIATSFLGKYLEG